MIRIAFLAVAQVHQHLHFLPVALRLAKEPGVEVYVLTASRAGYRFIRSYDPDRTLKMRFIWNPTIRLDGLFTPPRRRQVLRRWGWYIRRFPTVITTETTSHILKLKPKFGSRLIKIKHGMGDREAGYIDEHDPFDFILVAGQKDKERMVERGRFEPENIAVAGYAKFELIRPPAKPLFANPQPIVLYNPHFEAPVSSWWLNGEAMVREMERQPGWNFVVAPHALLKTGPVVTSAAPNILIDRGSIRSVDMTYTQCASVYVGDASSQVYEFVRQPRPCVFINSHKVAWRDNPSYLHWTFGEVIEDPAELGPALARAQALHPQYEPAQRAASVESDQPHELPASERQARAILDFIRRKSG